MSTIAKLAKSLVQKEVFSFATEDHKIERTVRYMPWFTDKICINVLYGDYTLPSKDGKEILHSHPWNYFTLILWGGYDEIMLDENNNHIVKRRRPGHFAFHTMPHYHALRPIKGKAITFFLRTKETEVSNYWVNGKPMNALRYWFGLGYSKQDIINGFHKFRLNE